MLWDSEGSTLYYGQIKQGTYGKDYMKLFLGTRGPSGGLIETLGLAMLVGGINIGGVFLIFFV